MIINFLLQKLIIFHLLTFNKYYKPNLLMCCLFKYKMIYYFKKLFLKFPLLYLINKKTNNNYLIRL
jgi:hypothetical protein